MERPLSFPALVMAEIDDIEVAVQYDELLTELQTGLLNSFGQCFD